MGEPGSWYLAAGDTTVAAAGDIETPNPACVYDHWLGGAHNRAVDREFGDRVANLMPATTFARHNQAFVLRAVRYLIDRVGIRQILDLGSGVPTVGNVHEIAQGASPDCRVVCVERDLVSVGIWEQVLEHDDLTSVIQCDLRDSGAVLSDPRTAQVLDFSRPIAVVMSNLHFVPDDTDGRKIINRYREAMSPGSHLVLSNITADHYPIEVGLAADAFKETDIQLVARTHGQVVRMFSGFSLLEPGVVLTARWRPEREMSDDARRSLCYGGVAAL